MASRAEHLISAAFEGDVAAVKQRLKSKRLHPDTPLDASGRTALMAAALAGHADVCKVLLAARANVNAADAAGFTALHLAAQGGHTHVCELLLTHGADVHVAADSTQAQMETPLHVAVCRADAACVRLLIRAGADLEAEIKTGETSLMLAVLRRVPVDICEALMDAGAALPPARGKRLILSAAAHPGNARLLQRLLDAGADPNAQATNGDSVLAVAGEYGDGDMCRLLIERGADRNAKIHPWGDSILHVAARNGFCALCKWLVETGADLNGRNRDGVTPVDTAAYNRKVEATALLLQLGANPEGPHPRTALYIAAREVRPALVSVLLEYDANANHVSDERAHTPFSACVQTWLSLKNRATKPDADSDVVRFARDGVKATAILLGSRRVNFRLRQNAIALLLVDLKILRPVFAEMAWSRRGTALFARHKSAP